MKNAGWKTLWSVALLIVWTFCAPRPAAAHCDYLDGPVVTAARLALEKGSINEVLGWIQEAQEPELRAAFRRTLAVRRLNPEAQELADLYFFETVVRLHRAGEGEPYTGLKPVGTPLEPAVAATDKALATGSADDLVKGISADVAAGLRQRFAKALEAKRHAGDSVQAGRAFAAAYVELTHYALGLEKAAAGPAGHGAEPAGHDHAHP